jgi:hypothetical protein
MGKKVVKREGKETINRRDGDEAYHSKVADGSSKENSKRIRGKNPGRRRPARQGFSQGLRRVTVWRCGVVRHTE